MKRRIFMKTLAAAPAAPVLLAQTPATPAANEAPPLKFAIADDAAETILKFFDQRQFASLRRLSDALMPPMNGSPGALDARVPEFLDFLLSESPTQRQMLYLSGLDTLEFQSQATFRKPFAQTAASESDSLLAPLRRPWVYTPPSTLVEFLRAAKQDVRSATINSREFALAAENSGRRGGVATGQYWKAVE